MRLNSGAVFDGGVLMSERVLRLGGAKFNCAFLRSMCAACLARGSKFSFFKAVRLNLTQLGALRRLHESRAKFGAKFKRARLKFECKKAQNEI